MCMYQYITNIQHCSEVWGKIFLKINTFIHLGHIHLMKSDSKDIYNVAKKNK